MTWTLVNSIADPANGAGSAAAHSAMVYLFDTFLPAHGWTVGAHPDASAFKRKLNYTYTTNAYTGLPLTVYYWANWSSTTPSSMVIYSDETYTSVPGDLCTFTSRGLTMLFNSNSYIGHSSDWRFWQSSDNANATLVTRGKKVWWYWPGWTTVCEPVSFTPWTPAGQPPFGITMPLLNNVSAVGRYGYPVTSPPSNTLYTMMPDTINGSYGPSEASVDGMLINGFQWGANADFNTLSSAWMRIAVSSGTDVLSYIPNVSNTARAYSVGAGSAGLLIQVGSNYYLTTRDITAKNIYALCFDMGTSEPVFT